MFNGIGYKYCIQNFFQCRFVVSSVGIGNKARIFNEFRFIDQITELLPSLSLPAPTINRPSLAVKDSNGVMEDGGFRAESGLRHLQSNGLLRFPELQPGSQAWIRQFPGQYRLLHVYKEQW